MAKKASSKCNTPPPIVHTCGECAFAIEDRSFINRSVNGDYFCIRCPHYTNGKYVRLKNWSACKMFKLRTK